MDCKDIFSKILYIYDKKLNNDTEKMDYMYFNVSFKLDNNLHLNVTISKDFKLEIKDYTKFDIIYSLTTLDFNEFEDVLKQKLKEYNIYVY